MKADEHWDLESQPVGTAVEANQDTPQGRLTSYHFKAPTISGMNSKGWGILETLLNYRVLHQLQVYRKIDEQVENE